MDFLLDLAKKWGVPTAILAVVATITVALPAFFFLDDRYAKAEQMQGIYSQLNQLTIEVGQLAGTEQVLVAVITSNSGGKPTIPQFPVSQAGVTSDGKESSKVEVTPTVAIPQNDQEKQDLLNQVAGQVATTQQHLQNLQAQTAEAKK